LLAIAEIHTFCAYFSNCQSVTRLVLHFQPQVVIAARSWLAQSHSLSLFGVTISGVSLMSAVPSGEA
jgi:hypothetical protein